MRCISIEVYNYTSMVFRCLPLAINTTLKIVRTRLYAQTRWSRRLVCMRQGVALAGGHRYSTNGFPPSLLVRCNECKEAQYVCIWFTKWVHTNKYILYSLSILPSHDNNHCLHKNNVTSPPPPPPHCERAGADFVVARSNCLQHHSASGHNGDNT